MVGIGRSPSGEGTNFSVLVSERFGVLDIGDLRLGKLEVVMC